MTVHIENPILKIIEINEICIINSFWNQSMILF